MLCFDCILILSNYLSFEKLSNAQHTLEIEKALSNQLGFIEI